MKSIVTFAIVTASALALTACGGAKEEPTVAPVENEMGAINEGAMMTAADDAMAMNAEAAVMANEFEPTGNPIGPGRTVSKADGEAAPAE